MCIPVGFAQNNAIQNVGTFPSELIIGHLNATTLLTGETLYCKFHCLDASRKKNGVSKVVYVELIDKDRKSIFKHKLVLENGLAYGDFFMPSSLSTGNYKLIAYTKWMLELSESNFFAIDVIVVNPFQQYDATTDTVSLQPNLRKNPIETLVSMNVDKKTYAHRERVTINIIPKTGSANGHYSVSVRKNDLVIGENSEGFASPKSSDANVKNALPEMRGELISGIVLSKMSTPAANVPVALSMPGNPYSFKISETTINGKFYFILDENPDNTKIVLQVMGNDRADFSIQLDENKKPDTSRLRFDERVAIPSTMRNAISERSIASQVENSYYDHKRDSIEPMPKVQPFFNSLAKTYVLDDYTRFPTMKETIIEVLKELYFKKDKDNYTLHLRNFTMDAEIYGSPLILVDGLLIQDFNELMEYGAKYIEKVSVINEPYIYGPKTFSGVVAFETKLQDFKTTAMGNYIIRTTVDRPLPRKTYSSPNYSPGNNLARIPDYRNQLLWIPEIEVGNGENVIHFYTSDVTGKFEITLDGLTNDGTPISIVDFIEVK